MALVANNEQQQEQDWTTCSVDIVTIVAGSDEVVFRCSKEDLIEKSPYFQAMFANAMRESQQNEVRLPFVEPEIFTLFINYFAVGYLPLTTTHLIDVYLQADQWFMPEARSSKHIHTRTSTDSCIKVKNQCKTCLKYSLDLNTCFVFLQATNSPILSELSTICENWIIEHYRDVIEHNQFGTLSKELLANLLRRRSALSEVDKLNAVLSWWNKQTNSDDTIVLDEYARVDSQSRKRKRISCEVQSTLSNDADKENRNNLSTIHSPIERSYSSPKFSINRSERLGPSPKKKQKTDQTERNDELRPLLSLINFSKMTVDQLLTVVEPSKVLSPTDLMHYLKLASDREQAMRSRLQPQSVVVTIDLPRPAARTNLASVKSGPFSLYGHLWEVIIRNSLPNTTNNSADEVADKEPRECDVCLVCLSELSAEGFYFKGGEMTVLNARKTKSKTTGAFEGAVFTKETPLWFRTIDRPLADLLRAETGFVFGADNADLPKSRLQVKINFPIRHAMM